MDLLRRLRPSRKQQTRQNFKNEINSRWKCAKEKRDSPLSIESDRKSEMFSNNFIFFDCFFASLSSRNGFDFYHRFVDCFSVVIVTIFASVILEQKAVSTEISTFPSFRTTHSNSIDNDVEWKSSTTIYANETHFVCRHSTTISINLFCSVDTRNRWQWRWRRSRRRSFSKSQKTKSSIEKLISQGFRPRRTK